MRILRPIPLFVCAAVMVATGAGVASAPPDWQTYTNRQHGFQFQYPDHWDVTKPDVSEPDVSEPIQEWGPDVGVDAHLETWWVGKDFKRESGFRVPPDWKVREPAGDGQRVYGSDRGGDPLLLVVADGGAEGHLAISWLGDNLNFSDCPRDLTWEECMRERAKYKLGLDAFMELAGGQDSMSVSHISLNGYNAYEVTLYEGPREENQPPITFGIWVEQQGQIFHISFEGRATKQDLSPAEQQLLSTFRFVQ